MWRYKNSLDGDHGNPGYATLWLFESRKTVSSIQTPHAGTPCGSLCDRAAPLAFAESDATGFSGNRLWTNELKDYAAQSLQNEDAMSMAAIPLNGPGINQYINADALMSLAPS